MKQIAKHETVKIFHKHSKQTSLSGIARSEIINGKYDEAHILHSI